MAYNILIVDDSSVVRKVLIKTFGMTSIDVNQFHQAENGKAALEIINSNWIDVIFLDINMPVMNGMEFMTHLNADQTNKDIPVIIVSTEGSKERKEELALKGVKAYLRKPVSPEELARTIEQVISEVHNEKK